MCAILIGVPGGKPLRLTTNVALAAVTLPAALRVRSKVTVALPPPVASASVMAGLSFDARSSAENVGFGCEDGDEAVSLVQADATNASAIAEKTKRFIGSGSFVRVCPCSSKAGTSDNRSNAVNTRTHRRFGITPSVSPYDWRR